MTKIEILPQEPDRAAAGHEAADDGAGHLQPTARVRDVTLEAFIESGNTEVAEPDKQGLVTVMRRGEAPVLARYEGAYAATTITVMGDRTGFEWKDVAGEQLHRRAGLRQAASA